MQEITSFGIILFEDMASLDVTRAKWVHTFSTNTHNWVGRLKKMNFSRIRIKQGSYTSLITIFYHFQIDNYSIDLALDWQISIDLEEVDWDLPIQDRKFPMRMNNLHDNSIFIELFQCPEEKHIFWAHSGTVQKLIIQSISQSWLRFQVAD